MWLWRERRTSNEQVSHTAESVCVLRQWVFLVLKTQKHHFLTTRDGCHSKQYSWTCLTLFLWYHEHPEFLRSYHFSSILFILFFFSRALLLARSDSTSQSAMSICPVVCLYMADPPPPNVICRQLRQLKATFNFRKTNFFFSNIFFTQNFFHPNLFFHL